MILHQIIKHKQITHDENTEPDRKREKKTTYKVFPLYEISLSPSHPSHSIKLSYRWGLNFLCPPHFSSLHLSPLLCPSLLSSSLPSSSPALTQEQLEALWTAFRHRQLQTVVAHPPDDGGWVHVLVGHLSGQHLPQHHAERPAGRRVAHCTFRHADKDVKWTDERQRGRKCLVEENCLSI